MRQLLCLINSFKLKTHQFNYYLRAKLQKNTKKKNKLRRFQVIARFEQDLSGDLREIPEAECDRKIDPEQIHPPVNQSSQRILFGYFSTNRLFFD